MEKKEFYRHALPHFQQQGQAYFVTWTLKDAVPPKALDNYKLKLQNIKSTLQILLDNKADGKLIDAARMEYYLTRNKFMKAFDDLLDLQNKSLVNLSKDSNRDILIQTLTFWEGKRLKIMLIVLCRSTFIGFLSCWKKTIRVKLSIYRIYYNR